MIGLNLVHPIYKKKVTLSISPEGETVPLEIDVLVRELKIRKWFKRDSFSSIEQATTKNDRISKTRSVVYDRYSARFYETWHSDIEIMETLYESELKKNLSVGFINNGSKVHLRKSSV